MEKTRQIKTLLTFDDLLRFCKEQQFLRFSSKESGYRLAVHMPTYFEEVETDDTHRGMIKLKIKVFHEGLNRNGSYVSHEAAEKAMLTIPDKPLLAAIHQLDNGEYDFEGHEMEEIYHEDGTSELVYIEKQVGSFTASTPAFWEYDEENDKNFVCAYAYISEEYTKAADIIRRKNGTKHSAELFIDELSYNAKENYLNLLDFYFNGGTLLGSRKDGTEIGEGMLGSRADIVDFSENTNTTRKEENDMHEENFEQVEETVELEEAEVVEAEAEETVTVENHEESEETAEVAETAEVVETEEAEDGETPEPVVENQEAEVPETVEEPVVEQEEQKFTKTFELSHSDIRSALYELLAIQEASDNQWYWIEDVYDDHFVYSGWETDKCYGQKYIKNGDEVTFDGERYELYKELLTASEKAELDAMRANYSLIMSQLKDYQAKEEVEKKKSLMASNEWNSISENPDFISLKQSVDEEKNEMTFEELKEAADKIQLEAAKMGELQFAEKKTNVGRVGLPAKKTHTKRYGSLFDGIV